MHIEGSLAASPEMFWPAAFTLTWRLMPYSVVGVAAREIVVAASTRTIAAEQRDRGFRFMRDVLVGEAVWRELVSGSSYSYSSPRANQGKSPELGGDRGEVRIEVRISGKNRPVFGMKSKFI